MDSQGKVVMESILETKASTLLEFFAGLRGSLFVTIEEGTWAAWLYDLLKPHVTEVLVCNPRKIPLLKQGNQSDKIDARKLAERLRLHDLKPVYHGETGIRVLRELARSYLNRGQRSVATRTRDGTTRTLMYHRAATTIYGCRRMTRHFLASTLPARSSPMPPLVVWSGDRTAPHPTWGVEWRSNRSIGTSPVLAARSDSARQRIAAEHGGVEFRFTPVHSSLLRSYGGVLAH
jgi:hypothetical protein